MRSLEGNTSVYLQYANTRALSVLARAGVRGDEATGPIAVVEPSERQLGLTLARFPEHLDVVLDELAPHKLTGYLFSVATAFTSFYEHCPVLTADEPVKRSRLALCALTSHTLERGLDLLGIAAPERL